MAKYKEEAVDYNPFEQTAPKYKEEAVDYDPFAPPKPQARVAGEDEGDFLRGISNVPGQIQNVYGGSKVLAGLAANKAGAGETGKSLIKSGMESMQAGEAKQVVKESDDFVKAWEKGIGTVITDWLPYQIGAGIGNLAETVAFSLAGAGAGAVTGAGVGALPGAVAGAVSKTLIKQGIKEAAEKVIATQGKEAAEKFVQSEAKKALVKIGATSGMVAQAGMHGTGEVTGRAVEEGQQRGEKVEDIELSRVLPAAAVHAVADFFVNKIGLDSLKIGEKATNSLILDIGKRIAVTGTKQLPAEEIQTLAERYGAKLSLTDAEAMREYVSTAAASYAMSIAPGAVGGARTNLMGKLASKVESKDKGDEDKKVSETGTENIVKENVSQHDFDTQQRINKALGITTNEVRPPANDTFSEDEVAGTAVQTDMGGTKTQEEADAANLTRQDLQVKQKESELQGAKDYLADIDNPNTKTSVNGAKLNKYLTSFGISKATGGGSVAINRKKLEDYLAQQGAPNVAKTGQSTTGTSTDVVVPTNTGAAATRAGATDASGMVLTDANAAQLAGRKDEQSAALAFDAKAGLEELNKLDAKLKKAEKQLLKDENLETGNPKIQAAKDNLAKVKAEVEKRKAELYKQFDGWTAAREQTKTTEPATLEQKLRNDLKELSDRVEALANDDKGRKFNGSRSVDKTLTKAVNDYNEFKAQHGIDDENDLAANYRNTEALKLMGKKVYATPRTDEEAVLASEEEEQANYEKNLKESYAGKESTYDQKNLPEGAQEEYEGTAKELNAEIKGHNEGLSTLIEKQEAAKQELKKAREALADYEDSQPDNPDINAVDPAVDRAEARIAELKAAYNEATKTLQEYGGKRTEIPPWSKLGVDEKDVYYSHIKKNTIEEHRTAGRKLQEYRAHKVAEGRTEEKPGKSRVINGYEESRAFYSKLWGVPYPPWSQLSKPAQNVYLETLTRADTNPETGKTTVVFINAGIQKPMGFAKIGLQLRQEQEIANKEFSEKEAETHAKLKEEVARLSRLQEGINKQLNEDSNRNKDAPVTTEWLPTHVVKMVMNKDFKGVLNYLRHLPLYKNAGPKTADHISIMKALAQALHDLNLNTKIEFVETLPNGDLAQYDPLTDTIKITPEGLTASTVLHEATHAGTVRVIHMYTFKDRTGQHTLRKNLTEQQRRGVEKLEAIMKETEDYLAINKTDKAFSNLFEFAAYALTDPELIQSLKTFGPTYELLAKFNDTKADITATPKEKKSAPETMWSTFKKTVAQILGVSTKPQVKKLSKSPNFLFEVASALDDILSVPTEPINLRKLPAVAEGLPKIDLYSKGDGYETDQDDKPKSLSYLSKIFTTAPGVRRIASLFQNDRYAIKYWEDINELAGKIYHEGKEMMNNIYTQITLAASSARNLYNEYVSEKAERLNSDISEFAKAADLSTDEALALLHKVSEALHEPERRIVKYILTVPLREQAKTGETMSPADLRKEIMSLLDTKTLDKDAAVQLKQRLEDVIFAKDAAGEFVLDQNGYRTPNTANVDPLGHSPRIDEAMKRRLAKSTVSSVPINLDADAYRVTVIEKDIAKTITEQYNNHPQQAMIKQVLDSVQQLHKATTELNKMANYWSQPVSNRVNFYGFENYVPLKGYSNTKTDEMLSFDTMRRGKELQDMEFMFGGRASISKNPILQTMSDATRSAMRAGRKDLTQSIKNALTKDANGKQMLAGKVGDKISFEDRQNPQILKDLPRENTVFHYNDDGSIQVLEIHDRKQREAIRRTYENSKPIVELANRLTSALGTLHTRYNYSFAPMNFVRDAMTNAFAIGADMGPAESARFIKAISGQVLKGGMYKSMQVAILYQKGDTDSKAKLKEMADSDPYIKNMMEFLEKGGMVSYLGALSLKSNFQALHKEIGRNGILKSKEQLDKFVDIWTDMFELASRSAAYGVAKQNFIGKGMTENAASVRAAAYAKNLANFEQVGELGKAMGAFYMFFRPAATGAVRAIESLAPAWPGSLERALEGLPPEIKNDATALATFEKNYAEKQKNARIMTTALIGLGMMSYMMASMMSDDDELGRNAVLNDNMQQWTRYARFHIPRDITKAMGINEPVVFQVPWGFGLGAFAASGAQMASVFMGKNSVKDAMANIFLQISLDSFIPIPVSKMPPTEMPLEFFLDSIAPSVARPILEFALNKNGLGQDIYNDQNRRFGDAYTGGDRIPEIYKDAARSLANSTMGGIDISPNTMYFLSNSYLDGIGRIFEAGYGIADLSQGRKGFNPRTDIPLLGSFFGAKSNVDSREFSAVEKQIQEMERKVKMFETDPVQSARYLATHPMDAMLVDTYNKQVNGQLKELRSVAKQYRQMQGIEPKTRDAMIKIITFQENLIKHNMIEQFKAYGVKP
jgi:hypothetical protein